MEEVACIYYEVHRIIQLNVQQTRKDKGLPWS